MNEPISYLTSQKNTHLIEQLERACLSTDQRLKNITKEYEQEKAKLLELESVKNEMESELYEKNELISKYEIMLSGYDKNLISILEPQTKDENISIEESKNSNKASMMPILKILRNEDHSSIVEKISIQTYNSHLSIIPCNQILANEELKISLFSQKTREIMLKMGSQYESLESKYIESLDRLNLSKGEIEEYKKSKESSDLKYKKAQVIVKKLKDELDSVKTNYEDQIKIMSEHIISLSNNK